MSVGSGSFLEHDNCVCRLVPGPGERVELHVYRLLRIGSLDPATHRSVPATSCSAAGVQLKVKSPGHLIN